MARDEHYTPFQSRKVAPSASPRLVTRYTKGAHVIEIHERTVRGLEDAREWVVFFDGGLHESRMYHGGRAALYEPELAERVKALHEHGWTEEPRDATH